MNFCQIEQCWQTTFSWFLPLFLNTSDWFLYSWMILFHSNSFGNQMEKRPFGIFPHGKMLSLEKAPFQCGKWDFSTRKKAFSRERLFPLEWQKSKKAISLIILSKFEFFPLFSRFQFCFSTALFHWKMKLSGLFYPLASLGNKIVSLKFHFPTQ